ncbi:hypothetical protein KNO81_31295 [Paraburkholderia sediminicola]|nr:hypothetical protein [Paraburkholderia sediminicola]
MNKLACCATLTMCCAALAGGVYAQTQNATAAASGSVSDVAAPVVVDARGHAVGPAIGAGVVLRVNGTPTYVPLERSGPTTTGPYSATDLQWGSSATPVFVSSDCSGSPLMQFYPPASNFTTIPLVDIYRPSVVARSGSSVQLYLASSAPSTQQAVASLLYVDGSCISYTRTVTVFAIETTIDLAQKYPEPLHIK